MEILLLLSAGFVAGALNSLAGGGSFIMFPALLIAGVPPVIANATNTFASLPGYVSGTIGFWKELAQYRSRLLPYSITALIGGYLGAELLLRVDDTQFSSIVPWLMGIAVILFAFGSGISGALAKIAGEKKRSALLASIGSLALLAIVCIYGGFFNAGLGIILLAVFAVSGLTNIHAMNGMKLLLSVIVAGVAVIRFALSGSIAWYEGSFAFVGALVGGYLSARLAHYIPENTIRNSVIVYGIVLTIIFFWKAYF